MLPYLRGLEVNCRQSCRHLSWRRQTHLPRSDSAAEKLDQTWQQTNQDAGSDLATEDSETRSDWAADDSEAMSDLAADTSEMR